MDSSFSQKGQKSSPLDPGGITKNTHEYWSQSVRVFDVRSVIDEYFSHFTATYNLGNNPTYVAYFRGETPQITEVGCLGDVAGSLSGKYFSLYSVPNNKLYYLWFNVDGGSVDPAIPNAVGIQVPIDANDSSFVIAAAIKYILNQSYGEIFTAEKINSVVKIQTVGLGEATTSSSGTSGFVLSTTLGTQETLTEISIQYSGTDPIYQGQVLKGYYYDIYNGKFSKNVDVDLQLNSANDSVAIANPDGDFLEINADGSINVNVSGTVPVSIDEPLTATIDQSVYIGGTINGQYSGQKFGFVYNSRQQILDSHDRIADFIYADFGTKNQRITEIEYTSATFPGITVKRTFTYTLVSGKYKRDNEIWSLI
jgi:hypothetical protein